MTFSTVQKRVRLREYLINILCLLWQESLTQQKQDLLVCLKKRSLNVMEWIYQMASLRSLERNKIGQPSIHVTFLMCLLVCYECLGGVSFCYFLEYLV